MDLVEASRKGLAIGVRHPIGGERLAAQVFGAPGGIVFADLGWDRLTGRPPYHFIAGQVKGEGPWIVGGIEVRVIDREDDPLADERRRWEAHLAEHPDSTRALCRELAAADLEMELAD